MDLHFADALVRNIGAAQLHTVLHLCVAFRQRVKPGLLVGRTNLRIVSRYSTSGVNVIASCCAADRETAHCSET